MSEISYNPFAYCENSPKYSCPTKSKVKAVITNGEGIIGRNYLHGVDYNRGGLGLEIWLSSQQKKNKKCYEVNITWNDYIDPNFNYNSDSRKYAIAKKIPFCNPNLASVGFTNHSTEATPNEKLLCGATTT